MFEKPRNPIIEQKKINGKECIHFTLSNTFTYDEAVSFITECKQLLDAYKDQKVIIIWQCLEMKSYETVARAVWQKAIKELRYKIDMIWLVTDSILIQAEAEIISFFTSYRINTVKSEDELHYKIAKLKRM